MLRVLKWFGLGRFRRKGLPVTMPLPPSQEAPASQPPAPGPIARTAPAQSAQHPSSAPRKRTPSTPPTGSETAEPIRDAEWARRQGGKDRRAGVGCWSYTAFLTKYRLPKNQSSLRLWAAYIPLGEQHLPARGRPSMSNRAVRPSTTAPVGTGPALSPQREKELRNLGAKAETRSDGVVTFRVTGRVVEQTRYQAARRRQLGMRPRSTPASASFR